MWGEVSTSGLLASPSLAAGAISFALCALSYKSSKYYTPVYCKGYQGLYKVDKKDWDTRNGSILHAILVFSAVMYVLFGTDYFSTSSAATAKYGPQVLRGHHFTFTKVLLGASFGYFVEDLIVVSKYFPKLGGAGMVAHHLACMTAIGGAIRAGGGHYYVCVVLLTELTTPFVHLRWMLDKTGNKAGRVYLFNGLTLVLTWMVGRIFLFVPVIYHVYLHWNDIMRLPWYGKYIVPSMIFTLAVLNVFWFYKLLKGGLKMLKSRKQKTESSSTVAKPGMIRGVQRKST